MAQLREIKNRIGAVKTIGRITKTMQMIATAKFTAAGHRAEQSRPYSQMIDEMVRQVASRAEDYASPLIDGPSERAGKDLLLVICSDRGLCGAYNANILRISSKHRLSLIDESDVVVETAGKKATGFFKFQGVEVSRAYAVGDTPKYEDVEAIAAKYLERYLEGEFDNIYVASMRYISVSRQNPTITKLLPLSRPEASNTDITVRQDVYDFTPSAAELLDTLLPTTINTLLYQLFVEAAVSEHVMRMIAMKAASDNAKDFGRTLNRKFNRARQAQITTELTEIVSGVAALEG